MRKLWFASQCKALFEQLCKAVAGFCKELQKRNKKYQTNVAALPQKEKLLRSIERQQTIKETLYLFLLQKREEASINLAVTEPTVKIVEYALTGRLPIAPKTKIVYLAALVLGLLIPFGVVYLMYLLDTKVHTKEDLKVFWFLIAEILIFGDQKSCSWSYRPFAFGGRFVLFNEFSMQTAKRDR